MMKNILIGLIVGVILGASATVIAGEGYPANSTGRIIGGVNCDVVVGNDGKLYPNHCGSSIRKFRDGTNICYVVSDSGISCVAGKPTGKPR